jgi:hypothetical protein
METPETLNIKTNVDLLDNTNSSNEELKEVTTIDETPFAIVKIKEGYIGVIGQHRITEVYLSKEILEKELKEFSWNRVTQVIWAVVEKFKYNKEELTQYENE